MRPEVIAPKVEAPATLRVPNEDDWEYRLVDDAVEANEEVVVALVVVELSPVKF